MNDAAARARALDPRTSFIVRAPAGSGKTELLIQRYLQLLSTVEAPESILAITFTRKAAAEMRTRVIQALRRARGARPEEEHRAFTWALARTALERSRASGWQLLENPARIGMQTIDSLCVAITRRMPWVARFGAIPEITEKAGPLYQEAARLTLLGQVREDAVMTLLLHLDNNFSRAQNLLAQMLEKRDQWLRHISLTRGAASVAIVRDQIETCLKRIVEEAIGTLDRAAVNAGVTPPAGATVNDHAAWIKLADDLITKDDTWRKRSPMAQRLSGNDHLLACFVRVRNLPPAQFNEKQWSAMEAIVELLPIAAGYLKVVFREHATVDFIELTLASLLALADSDGPSDLGLALGYGIQHILLDEFQDTSYSQFALIEGLTQTWDPGDGRTLFLVGDPAQSIYRFRQAEVGLFLRAWQNGIGHIALETLTLSVNFRSGTGIVDWVNGTFGGAFPQVEDALYGAVIYTASTAADRVPPAAVEVHAFVGESSRTKEAERVANLTAEAREQGTVGILVRARSHLPAIVAALKKRGVRYQAIEIDELGERAVIQDLMALTFALLHAADRISWLAVLRAPWCGLTLHELAGGSPDAAVNPSRARTEAVLASAIGDRGRRTLRELVEQTWIRLGGPACVTAQSDLDDAAAYFDLLDAIDEGGDLADFEVLRELVRGLFAQPDATADGRVQIMTIHKAKGLEFDTVLLPGLGAQPKKDEGQLILWHEPSADELLFAPITETGSEKADGIYRYLSRLEQQKSDYEAVRLLYVAATRARRSLHLLGCANLKADASIAAASGSFLKILWPAVQAHFAALTPPTVVGAAEAVVWQPRPIRRLLANWHLPEPPAPVQWTRTDVSVSDVPEIAYEWVGDTLRHAGTVVHRFLARIGREGLGLWEAPTVRSRERTYRTMLKNLGVPENELDYACGLVLDALLRSVSGGKGRWILGDHMSAQCELAISGVSDGQVYEAVIDRTFIDVNGSRWIIDYKTSTHTGGAVDQFLATEKRRYSDQLERYARLLAQQDDRAIRLGLFFPLVEPGWVEWAAPLVMRRQASLFADSGAVLR